MQRLVSKDEMIRKGVELIMNPDKKEEISFGLPYRFQNNRLVGLKDVEFEKVQVYFDGNWHLNNISRKEDCVLNSGKPIPTRVNEAQFAEGFRKLAIALGSKAKFNLVMVKEPRKVNYRVAYLEVTE